MLRFVLEGEQRSRVSLSPIRHPVGLTGHKMPADSLVTWSKDDSQGEKLFIEKISFDKFVFFD